MTGELVAVESLSLAIDGKDIIHDISFSMNAGDIRALIGPNGAGKSTTARCVAGIASGWTGGIRLSGRDIRRMKRGEIAGELAYLPQHPGDAPAFSVREYVLLGRYVHSGLWGGLSPRDLHAADAGLADAGIADLADRPLSTLSGGERQMAAIAAGLAQEARLLVLDEPAAFLDPPRQERLLELVRRLNRERGVSFLIVTHDLNAAMRFAHRVLALRDGRVVFDGPAAGLADRALLRGIYDMDFDILAAPAGRSVVIPAGEDAS